MRSQTLRNRTVVKKEKQSEDISTYIALSEKIPGWTRNEEAQALAEMAYSLEGDAVIVEIGTFFGSGTVLLAGARKLKGTGKVHCIDPFDGSGDSCSVPHYHAIILATGPLTPRQHFDENMSAIGLSSWIEVHEGSAEEIAPSWTTPIDFIFFDGDQSPAGVRAAYDAWSPWLKPGGVIALHNSQPREYERDHDGHYLIAVEEIQPPRYLDRHLVGSITFARKVAESQPNEVEPAR